MKIPYLTTAFSESGRRAKKRFVNILDTKAKRIGIGAALLVALSGLIVNSTVGNKQSTDLDQAIAEAIIGEKKGEYARPEDCFGEGHIIIGSDIDANKTIVYIVTSYSGFQFMNDKLTEYEGGSCIPAVLTFKRKDSGRNDSTYELESYEEPMDGALWVSSIEEMFPSYVRSEILDSQRYRGKLWAQMKKYAEEYLKELGRDAQVVTYAELNTELADIEVQASNKLLSILSDMKLYHYPYFIGTEEWVEDGVRYVYEQEFLPTEGKNGKVIYKKYLYGGASDEESCAEYYEFDVRGENVELVNNYVYSEEKADLMNAMHSLLETIGSEADAETSISTHLAEFAELSGGRYEVEKLEHNELYLKEPYHEIAGLADGMRGKW